MQTSLIDQGVTLMLFGMGTVFVFLTVLVVATTLMSRLVNKFASVPNSRSAQAEASNTQQPALSLTTPNSTPDPKLVSIIEQAVAAHRAKNK